MVHWSGLQTEDTGLSLCASIVMGGDQPVGVTCLLAVQLLHVPSLSCNRDVINRIVVVCGALNWAADETPV